MYNNNDLYLGACEGYQEAGDGMIPNNKERLQKLKTLAERGIGGERDNAKAIFEKLCEKYDISPEAVESSLDEVKPYWFRHKRGHIYAKLLCQCIYKTLGKDHKKYTRGTKRSEIGTDCTPAQAMEIELDYSFYAAAFDGEIKRLFEMFVQRNDIFPPTSEESEEGKKPTYEDILLYRSIKKQTRTPQIAGTTQEQP